MPIEQAAREIIAGILEGRITTKAQLLRAKVRTHRIHKLAAFPQDPDILRFAKPGERKKLSLLGIKPTRTLSGVSPVAVMTDSRCPHGTCLYCPRGEGAAQSYTGLEPAARRATQHSHDPFEQTQNRIEQLENTGHTADKIELIIMGGTFNARPWTYQSWFVRRCLDAMNGPASRTLAQAQKLNETAAHRCIGMTIETRPDWSKPEQVDRLLTLGATRVELGVQNPDDQVYKKVGRAHTVKDVVEATAALKDAFLKVGYHMMPGLFSAPAKDVAMFRRLFTSADFMPDMLKIYPCLVLEGTGLYDLWKAGKFVPYTTEQATEVIAQATKHFPRWLRVMRMQRDIPVKLIKAGVNKSNLTELVEARLSRQGARCNCIRCREAGRVARKRRVELDWSDIEMNRIDYRASGGREVFLSFDDAANDAIIAFARLRLPAKPWRPEITETSAGIRELHVYGPELHIGGRPTAELQHRGFGRALLAEAERIAQEEWGSDKLLVMSGIGARQYYEKLGYDPDGAYMSKEIR